MSVWRHPKTGEGRTPRRDSQSLDDAEAPEDAREVDALAVTPENLTLLTGGREVSLILDSLPNLGLSESDSSDERSTTEVVEVAASRVVDTLGVSVGALSGMVTASERTGGV